MTPQPGNECHDKVGRYPDEGGYGGDDDGDDDGGDDDGDDDGGGDGGEDCVDDAGWW